MPSRFMQICIPVSMTHMVTAHTHIHEQCFEVLLSTHVHFQLTYPQSIIGRKKTFSHTRVHKQTYTLSYIHTHARTHLHTHILLPSHTRAHTHLHSQAHKHTHWQTPIQSISHTRARQFCTH